MKSFEELGLNERILQAIGEQGYEYPMPIQEAVIPVLLGNGDESGWQGDMVALAQTGTGKTAAYGLPIVQLTEGMPQHPVSLILAPTRELCLQIADDLEGFSKHSEGVRILPVYGGTSIEAQIRALKRGINVLVATPGRLIDLMKRGAADLSTVRNVVLDEADEMLTMGFQEDLNEILGGIPEEHRTLLFSATMSKEIESIARKYLKDTKEIQVGSRNEGAEHVNHIYYMVKAQDKYLALKRVVDYYPRIYGIVFCRTRMETQEIADKLIQDGYNADALHGDLSQQQRDLTMQKFRQHTVQFLVATDVAARGLDVDDLTHVINYGLPDDIESYTHRSGRTGRAGKKGTSISIIHTKEKFKVRQIEKQIGKDFVDGTLPAPEEICKKQLFKTMDDIMKTDVDDEQIAPYMEEINRQFEYIDKEDIIKKMVTITFGKFLDYYKNAPEIIKPDSRSAKAARGEGKADGNRRTRQNGPRKAEAGYRRLFVNLGKDDGFYPGEVMQFLNKCVPGRVQVGHIDLLGKFSYIEVPEEDADRVMQNLNGQHYKRREVRCNDADEAGHGNGRRSSESAPRNQRSEGRSGRGEGRGAKGYGRADRNDGRQQRGSRGAARHQNHEDMNDWRSLMNPDSMRLRGEEPDFSEEGWARRRPKKK